MRLQYETAHLALASALPELRPCIDRLMGDWGGDPPGQYIVFDPYQVWIKVLVGLARQDIAARELLRRALDLAEEMLTSEDRELRYLAIDACAEVLCELPGSDEVVEQIAGPALRDWMAQYCSANDGQRQEPEVIDLWGVREAVAASVPGIPLHTLPGVTQPADHHRLDSLAEARASADGAVLLQAFGKSGMFVLARASIVQCSEQALQGLAVELAPVHHHKDSDTLTRGKPTAAYFAVAANERVWNMRIGTERHARLTPGIHLWVSPALLGRQLEIGERFSHT